MPVIGFLSGGSPDGFAYLVRAFRQGLSETGYVEGQNVAIEFRWADGQYHRLPNLLADLVDRQVSVIAATTTPGVLAAKAASKTVPIVFATDGDPVQLGLVASLSQPGGNVTGVTQLNVEVAPKRVELAHDLIPSARSVGLLVNPTNPLAEAVVKDSQAAAAGTLAQRFCHFCEQAHRRRPNQTFRDGHHRSMTTPLIVGMAHSVLQS